MSSTSSKNKIKICICMFYTSNIESYSKLAVKINKNYADKHGYDFIVTHNRKSDRGIQWEKVWAVEDIIKSNKYDYIFWIDSDAFFNKQDISLEKLILENNSALISEGSLNKNTKKENIYLHICDDLGNSGGTCLVNTGTFLVKNNDWSKKFFNYWWCHKEATTFYWKSQFEQHVLDYIIKNELEHSKYIQVYSARMFNSICRPPFTTALKEDFIVHVMASSHELRYSIMEKYIEDNKL